MKKPVRLLQTRNRLGRRSILEGAGSIGLGPKFWRHTHSESQADPEIPDAPAAIGVDSPDPGQIGIPRFPEFYPGRLGIGRRGGIGIIPAIFPASL